MTQQQFNKRRYDQAQATLAKVATERNTFKRNDLDVPASVERKYWVAKEAVENMEARA